MNNRVSKRHMKSESEMPLQVSSTSTTPFMLPSMISDNSRESIEMPGSSGDSANTSHTLIEEAGVGDRPIVALQTQNSLQVENVRNVTSSLGSPIESRHAINFSEHRKKRSTDTSADLNEQQAQQQSHSSSQQIHDIEDKQHNTIINHTIGSADFGFLSSEFPPITQKPVEERNRGRHLDLSTIESSENIAHTNRRRMAGLPHLPQPPTQYTATAAEIALGKRDLKRDATSFQRKEADEDASRTSASTDSITAMSPGSSIPNHENSSDRIIVGTPSTVSTAPSSDDEALLDYKLDESSALPNLLHPINQGQRAVGEDVMFSLNDSQRLHRDPRQSIQEVQRSQNPWMQQIIPTNLSNASNQSFPGATSINTHHYPLHHHQSQPRVASFRSQENVIEHGKTHPPRTQRMLYHSSPKEHYPPQHFSNQTPLGNRKLSYAYHVTPKSATPPRTGRNQRQHNNRQTPLGGQGSNAHQPGSSLQRSSSEVLKTLLRKKACLYEPNTSRAVALVTWLVGRLLALEFGFFSRQQLQSGVHACVSNKIEAGTITRTKVNRCMQIILNSCFHYIIPRSDGTEEKGDYFRASFSQTVHDDSLLLRELPEPWNDLLVDRDIVLHAILHDIEERNSNQTNITTTGNPSPAGSPKLSPKISSVNVEKSQERYFSDGDKEEASKRAVLLCFNENVRSAEDVFRCHNDFIRDTANASNLQLSTIEWSQFFGVENSLSQGNTGVSMLVGAPLGGPPDLLGRMNPDELGKFRTTWCTKRYEHDHDLCGFAHVEVNGGWLRRNPTEHLYKNEMCKFVSSVGDDVVSPGNFFLNECPNGTACDHAHSLEEIDYHPLTYKHRLCAYSYSKSGGCRLGDVCPNAHPPDNNRPLKKSNDGRSPDKRGKKNFDQGKSNIKSWASIGPSGSPIVYASPAPTSNFERQLGMPGLQNLYRRQSEVIRAYVRSSGKSQPTYSLFDEKVATFTGSSSKSE